MQQTRARTVSAVGLVFAAALGSCSDPETNAQSTTVMTTITSGHGASVLGAGGSVSPATRDDLGMPASAGTRAGTGTLGQGTPAANGGSAGSPGAAGGAAGAPSTAAATGSSGAPGAPGLAGSTAGATAPIAMGVRGDKQPMLPAAPAECPTLTTGMITVMGQQVRLWVGPQKGPMVFYWHGTGSVAEEAISGLGPGLNEVMSQGGVVASFTTTTQMGQTTGNGVWYSSDFDMADQILACANQQGLIDPQRIYSAGCSAGGIHTSTMAYARSGYLAASAPNSGGIIFPTPLQDMSHVPFQMSSHGARDVDVVHAGQANAMIDVYFADITANNNKDLVSKGGFAVNCDHGGQHCANPPELTAAMWEFLKAHTFDTMTSPYAGGLPASFPSYCEIVR